MDIHQRLARDIRAAAALQTSIEDKTASVVRAYCRASDEDWTLFSYHLMTTHRFLPGPNLPQIDPSDSPVAAVEEIITDAISRGEIRAANSELLAAAALGVVLQSALHVYYGRLDYPLSAYEEFLTKAVIAVLKS